MKKFVILGLALMALSCSKEEVKKSSTLTKKVDWLPENSFTVSDYGYLVIANQESFGLIIDSMLNHQTQLDDLYYLGFISSNKAFEQISEEIYEEMSPDQLAETYGDLLYLDIKDTAIFIEPTIDAHLLSYLANLHGFLQIGDTLYKFGRDTVWSIASENSITLINGNLKSPEVNSQLIYRDISSIYSFKDFRECTKGYDHSGKKHIAGDLHKTNVGLYVELGGRVKHRKKGFLGGWYYDKTSKLEYSGSGTVSLNGYGNNPQSYNFNKSCNNCSSIKYTISSQGGWGNSNNAELNTASHLHKGKCDDNQWRQCTIIYQ